MSEQKDDFWLRYSNFCVRSKVYPLKSVLRHLKGTELCCPVESIRPEHWLFALSALCHDNSLTKVHFASTVSPHGNLYVKSKRNLRDKGFPTPYGRSEQNIKNMCMALGRLMHSSTHISVLKLENLSIKLLDAKQLASGLAVSTVTHVSFSGCQFESNAVPMICNSLCSSKITWLDLSTCALNSSDVEAVGLLIKVQSIKRGCELHAMSLRNRIPNFSAMDGLRRISLNCNQLEHKSVLQLIENMADDLWMKAVDLQNCGIENEAAEAFLKLVCKNCELEIIDLRLNDIDDSLLHRLDEQLALNRSGKTSNYSLTPLWTPSEMVRKYNTVRKVKVPKKPTTHKLKITKKTCRSMDHSSGKLSSAIQNETETLLDAGVQTSNEKPKIPKFLQDIYFELREKYQQEVKLRKYLVSKLNSLKVENGQLRNLLKNQNDEIYIDQETYFDIKHTFEKLKIFFDVMKKYGLWEYISGLGFNETDVTMTENDSRKQMTLTRKQACCHNNKCRLEPDDEPCCKCRKMDPKHRHTESCSQTEKTHNCVPTSNVKAVHDKYASESIKEYFLKERGPYRLLQELVNDYNNASNLQHYQKPLSEKQTSTPNVPQDKTKTTSSKHPCSASPKPSSGTQLLIKKFSYSNMPKKLKDLISPADFFKIVRKELERCEIQARKSVSTAHVQNSSQTTSKSEIQARKPISTAHVENSSQTSSISEIEARKPISTAHVENSSQTTSKNEIEAKTLISTAHIESSRITSKSTQIHSEKYVPVKNSATNTTSTSNKESTPVSSKQSTPKCLAALDSDDEDITISELIARERAMFALKQNKVFKHFPTKKEPAKSSVSSVSSSRIPQKSSLFRDREIKKSDQRQSAIIDHLNDFVISKLKVSSNASQTSSKKTKAVSNAASEESSNSVVTENDKLSASSTSNSKLLSRSSSSHSESEPQKSYIESVSDASTFRDVKSISVSEIASEILEKDDLNEKNACSENPVKSVSSQSNVKGNSVVTKAKGGESKNKSLSSVKSTKDASSGSQSSTVKDVPTNQNAKSDKSAKVNSLSQGKAKNGKNSKNRPKSNSKSSSVPSLSDITTVSSQSLNTDSVMKQISGSEDN